MKELYCITCPVGCLLTVTEDNGGITVEGNTCKRGAEFAIAEIRNPMRTLTTTVRTTFPGVPVLPVRTDGEIPKGKIADVMRALNSVVVRQPLGCGDTVMENAADTGVRIIVTSNLLRHDARERVQPGSDLT